MPYVGPNTKKKKRIVLLIYLPTLRQWIMDTGSFTNSECTFFFATSGNERCEKNGAGYRIECLRDGGMEDQPYTKEKHQEMLSPEEWNI